MKDKQALEAPDKVWRIRQVPVQGTRYPTKQAPCYQAVTYIRTKRAEGMHSWKVSAPLTSIFTKYQDAKNAVTTSLPYRNVSNNELALRLSDLVPDKASRAIVRLGESNLCLFTQDRFTAKGGRVLVALSDDLADSTLRQSDYRLVQRLGRFTYNQLETIRAFGQAYNIVVHSADLLPIKRGAPIHREYFFDEY